MDSLVSDRRTTDADREPQSDTVRSYPTETTARRVSPDPVPVPLPAAPADATSPQLAAAAHRPAPGAKPPKRRRGRLMLAAVLLAGVAGGGHYGWHWWTVGRFQESTDNAFLQADKVTVAPKVAGFVASVLVADNQPVKAGDVMATLDDTDFRLAVNESQAELEKATAQMEGFKAGVIQQLASVDSAKADVANAEAALDFSQREARRTKDLLTTGAGTVQRAEQTDSDLRQRTATLVKARAALDSANKQVETFKTLQLSGQAAIDVAKAKLAQAEQNMTYTVVRAPVDGVVGDRSVRKGQLVQAGTGLLTVVPMGRDIYLIANFKETQLGHMKEGQPVAFTVDAYGGHVFHGTVDSFSPGTGAQFALLPPENATGNFTKVVQRVPVRIALADDPLLPRLRPGLSVEATVETRGGRMPDSHVAMAP
jgi:membrane fusion protein, multidrug efflux system